MPTNTPKTRTLSLPDLADRFAGSPPSPPDGYVLAWSGVDGYYLPRPSSKILGLSFPVSTPYNVASEDVVEVPSHVGTFTVNLPISPLPGTNVYIKDSAGTAAANPINVVTTQLIDTQNPYQINNNFGAIKVVFTGSTWSVISKV